MKTLRKFAAYLDDGDNHVDKIIFTANSIIEAKKYLHGNGEIIKIKDISDEYPISLSKVKNDYNILLININKKTYKKIVG